MKAFVCILICLLSANYATAQYARCVNPNQRAGLCVHINDCQTLYSVLKQPNLSSSVKEFIKASGCGMGRDNRPFVCCTQDTGYTRSRRLTPFFNDYEDINAGNNNDFYWEAPAPAPTQPTRSLFFPQDDFGTRNFNNFDEEPQVQPPGRSTGGV
ncbi:uncharacterized protein LOC115620248 [Scaptodrosophila lebanonensis]|uniref:Uncharacterized protein LOC115620248 n=1 Tax=Drosophila lebanonensis TaxID=7225 RepID=A0A6J2T301_DROLE|nr:uncharacterized protein LOC115620248 [Scaptodrosophila lebanonensis]